MNLQVVELIFKALVELDPVVTKLLGRLLDSGVLVGPLAKLAPFVQEVKAALELIDKLHLLQMPAPTATPAK